MTWHIDIERVSNGYILRHPSDVDDDFEVTHVIVEYDTVHGKLEAATEMLYEVADYFDLLGSKYDERRLSIGTRPGEYHEDLDETRAESEEGDTDEHLYERAED